MLIKSVPADKWATPSMTRPSDRSMQALKVQAERLMKLSCFSKEAHAWQSNLEKTLPLHNAYAAGRITGSPLGVSQV